MTDPENPPEEGADVYMNLPDAGQTLRRRMADMARRLLRDMEAGDSAAAFDKAREMAFYLEREAE